MRPCLKRSPTLQVLHVAVLRRHNETAEALLAAGFPAGEESERGWLALDVAVEAEDRPLVKVWCIHVLTTNVLELKTAESHCQGAKRAGGTAAPADLDCNRARNASALINS